MADAATGSAPRESEAALRALLERIMAEAKPAAADGAVASYIPALARVPAERFGVAISFADGLEIALGDADEPFSIQSCSKIFTLAFALERIGAPLWRRVGREPSGMSFNSLILLEREGGVPRNPLINAGAIVTTDALLALEGDWADQALGRMRRLGGAESIVVDEEVYASEETHGDLNRAIAWFLKAKGNLLRPPDAALRAYFRACATAMSCRQLARAARFLIGAPLSAETGAAADPVCGAEHSRRIRAVMRTCGLYDAAGDFAYRVGLPAKSGVGGGLIAVSPGRYSVCVWSPALDAKGNSAAGQRALELLVDALEPSDRHV
ncbi:MAG: glutaminase [Pseudomonadota bacterium]